MGEICVARQPIFNSGMKLFGYELLYRRDENSTYEGTGDDQAAASLLTDSFFIGFDDLIAGTRGFINFSPGLLLSGTPLLLPGEKLVVGIAARTEITPVFMAACQRLKDLGYRLALDDFSDDKACAPLASLADIIRVDCHRTPLAAQAAMIKKYPSAVFVAIKVETADEFRITRELGYSLFQGYFFNKPVTIKAREIGTLDTGMVQMVQRLSEPDADFKAISAVIERDVDLSYKLLRIANSVFYRTTMAPVSSIWQAVVRIGFSELRRWTHLLLLKGFSNTENAELVKASLIRARMLSLFAEAAGCQEEASGYFLTGLFSFIDALLNKPMDTVLARLPLTPTVKDALLGVPGPMRDTLEAVMAFERADWDAVDAFLAQSGHAKGALTPIYLEAVKWQQALVV